MRNAAHQLIFVIALLSSGSGCGGRQHTLSASMLGVDAAGVAFTTWDTEHQDALVASATSIADGQAKLGEYRAARAKIEAAFAVAYRALAAAALDKDSPMKAALDAVKALDEAIASLRGPLEPSPAPTKPPRPPGVDGVLVTPVPPVGLPSAPPPP